jgi:hypothetical protein
MARGVWGLLVAALTGAPAGANDAVASLALGGIELGRTAFVEMREEELYISPNEVRVRYVFRNMTDKGLDTLVAFPLPPISLPLDFDYYQLPFEDQPNYVGFTTRIDGVEVALNVESRAVMLGLDRTDRLTELGVPLIPFDPDAVARIASLPVATRRALRADLLIDDQNQPQWALQTTLWRQQVFPAGRDVVVEHAYVPVRGGSAVAPVGTGQPEFANEDGSPSWAQESRVQYCVEPEMEGELDYRRTNGVAEDARNYSASYVDYILTTATHWRGAIGRFRLVAEVPNEHDAVFVCLPGAVRVAPNRIEAEITDFWPERELSVLFVHLYGEGIERDD